MTKKNPDSENYDLNQYRKKSNQRRRKKKVSVAKIILIVACSLIILMIGLGVGGYAYLHSMLNRVDRDNSGMDVSVDAEVQKTFEDYKNIALLGIDTRENDDEGRSDAIIILTLDSVHDKIKMTSIARDTYVEIMRENGKIKKDKITHAYMYGKAPMAVDTLNRNFELNITDYVSINFYGFVEIIDEIGGVWVDVSSAERRVMNKNIATMRKETKIKCENVTKSGYQLLSGAQALVYSRDRDTGSDIERGGRQREVLAAMFDQVKNKSLTELVSICGTILDNCTTSMTNGEMIDIGQWALRSKPTIENLGLPDESCKASGKTIGGIWYFVYDIDFAAKKIHDFILETGDYVDPASSITSSK